MAVVLLKDLADVAHGDPVLLALLEAVFHDLANHKVLHLFLAELLDFHASEKLAVQNVVLGLLRNLAVKRVLLGCQEIDAATERPDVHFAGENVLFKHKLGW